MKKTIFSKIFKNNIFSALLALFILTSTQFSLISNYITDSNEKALKKNAHIIAALVKNGTSMEYLSTFMVGFSKSINRNIIIIDNTGEIIMHSFVTEDFGSGKKTVPEAFCREVLSNVETTVKGSLGGVYSSNMLTLQIPIVNLENENQVLGAVMISMPFPEMQEMQRDLFKISFLSMLVVIFVSFIFSFTVSKKICVPIRQISNTAEKFAKRSFGERIDLAKSSYNIKEMRELADTFNHMANDLEKSEEIRNNFISDVSHELRTPMTTIKGFVDGILDGTIPEESRNTYLKIVSDEVSRLTKLVNNFLDVSRMENNNTVMEFKNFDIAEVIRIGVIGLENRIEQKHISVELNFEETNMYVYADYDSIKRVVTNLLDNAVKFTNENGKIVASAKRRKKEIVVSIYNTGMGISKDDSVYVFKRFYKADKSRSINKEGTGIGLYIVNDIIAKHGKKITVESKEGEYAEFIFALDSGKALNKS